jgi:outer membrane receptor protein involved in Fe transport
VTSALHVGRDESHLYPTLHAGWRFDDKRQLTASYSQRVSRPNADQFNPFVFKWGRDSESTGDPTLRPQQTDRYELRFDAHDGPTLLSVTGYFDKSRDGVAGIVTDLGGGLLLTRQANVVAARHAGLESSLSGKWGPKLSFNVNVQAQWTSFDAAPGLLAPHQGWGVGGSAVLNWQATPKDFVQLNTVVTARQVEIQGYGRANVRIDLGWRHKFNDAWWVVAVLQDAADSSHSVEFVTTPTLRSRSEFNGHNRRAAVSLVWSFGRGPKRDPGFDFSGGAGAGGGRGPQ